MGHQRKARQEIDPWSNPPLPAMHPPLGLGMMGLGAVYFVFAPSIVATPWAGHAARRFGPRNALYAGLLVAIVGLWLLSSSAIQWVITGMVLVALGTFFAQATATGQVSRAAGAARGTASGFYLAAYFAGGLTGAATIGVVFDGSGWQSCLLLIAAALVATAVLGISFPGKGSRAHDRDDQ
jgi:predicted MFS family arabinose efflux permease